MPAQELAKKLDIINSVLPIDQILNRQSAEPKEVSRYYNKNRLAYRIFNSKNGFVHMGISQNDVFSEQDFYAQGDLVSESVVALKAKNILELAPGKAATTTYLANKFPACTFYCIDLPHGQFSGSTKAPNIVPSFGDYHDLSEYKDNSMDVVYVIEALCHAANKEKVIREVFRVLKSGGHFIVIDGYYSDTLTEHSEAEITAMRLVAKSMMVTDTDQTYDYFLSCLTRAGLFIIKRSNYSKNILPSLRRLERLASRFFKRPRIARLVTYITGDIVTANAAAGYLMPYCIENNLFEYQYTLAVKQF
ncbi:MAG: methyltransferase domain-containing protein [Patescibacteria group bacterium]|nr:methyltransferase domain-containing protein [Patescibacteria group bacterium]